MNTTDNQVTAQVKAEPTVAKTATRTAASEGEHKQTRRRTNTRRPAGEGRTRQYATGEQNVNLAKLVHHVVNVVKIHAIRELIMVAMVKTVITTVQIIVPQTATIKRLLWN